MNEKPQCDSLRVYILREDSRVVYLRCEGRLDHESPWHRSWARKWKDDQETGWIEEHDDET